MDVAGRDVTRYLKLLLRKEGHVFHEGAGSSEFEIVREIKEQKCRILSSVYKEEPTETAKVKIYESRVLVFLSQDLQRDPRLTILSSS